MANQVVIRTLDDVLSLTVSLGNTVPKISGGVGGWTQVARQRKTAMTVYQGRVGFTMTLNLLFDGYVKRRSVERDLRILKWMALPPSDGDEPRQVEVTGNLPFPSGGPWVINDISEGDIVIWTHGYRLRQDADVTLLQYIRPDRAAFKSLELGTAPPKTRVVSTKVGDTLRKLAVKYLHDVNRYRDIADLNGIRDPSVILKPGTSIRIPTGKSGQSNPQSSS